MRLISEMYEWKLIDTCPYIALYKKEAFQVSLQMEINYYPDHDLQCIMYNEYFSVDVQ
jgi:hypothetical protein